MKSVTIKDKTGYLLLKVIRRKNWEYEMIIDSSISLLNVEVRDDKNQKINFT